MLNGLEEFLGFQPNFCIVGDCFRLVEELFFNCQSFISAKKIMRYILVLLLVTANLKLTFLTSKNYEKYLLRIYAKYSICR